MGSSTSVECHSTFDNHLRQPPRETGCSPKCNANCWTKAESCQCTFATSILRHLGHLIDDDGIRPDPNKLDAIDKFPSTHDITSLKSFLGLASYYWRFVPGFARLATPLYKLLKRGVKWNWTNQEQQAMRIIQNSIIKAPTLVGDNEICQLELKTDACKIGLGAVLSRIDQTGERHIVFISRRPIQRKRITVVNELECCSLVWALQKLRHYLYGRRFTAWTDSPSLRCLYSKKEVEGKLVRWILSLQEFEMELKHIKGEENVVADALFRHPVGPTEDTDPAEEIVCVLAGQYHPPEDVALLQQGDEELRKIIIRLRENSNDPSFVLYKHCLYKKNQSSGSRNLLVVLSYLRRQALHACHDHPTSGHMGITKPIAKISQRYWWKGLSTSVKS